MNATVRNLLVGGGILVAVVFLVNRRDSGGADPDAGFTENIPGPIDELGAATNRVLGGLPSRFGRFLGDLIDPVNRMSLDELTRTPPINPAGGGGGF